MSTSSTVLVVTADAGFEQATLAALADDAPAVLRATSSDAALQQVAQGRPDLVLLDVELPGLDAIEMCRQLVATYGDEGAPIALLSAAPSPANVAAAFGAGAAEYLPKSASPDELRARLRSLLQNFLLLKQQIAIAEQLSRANAAKNRFIGMAAHDMRNPLVSIRGFAEFLMDGTVGPMPPVQLALVSIIHGTSNLMIKTLNELLDVATIEAGQLKLQVATHALADLAMKSIAQAKIEARKKRSRIEFSAVSPGPVLTVDGDKVKQVIDNLLSNAIKFSPAASTITVSVEAALDGQSCTFTVRDEGPGLPEQARARLVRSSTLASEPAGDEKSAGLGLIITRNIVAAHGGEIAATNLTPKGCAVRVTLPAGPSR